VVDWQFPDFQSKISSYNAFRFDDNLLRTNYMLHSTAGGMHYLLTRSNGFGVAPSFAAAAASSVLYETLLEWREVISINDLIVTPLGGIASGEFMNQLGNYLNSEQPSVRTEVRGTLGSVVRGGSRVAFGLPRAVHAGMDEPAAPLTVARDNLGLSSAYAHAFRLRLGQESVFGENQSGEMLSVRSEIWIAAMPGFQRPGSFGLWFSNGNFTSFRLRIAGGSAGQSGELDFDSHLFGYYGQDFSAGSTGSASEFAIASGLRYADRRELGDRQHYGIVHLPHPTETVWLGVGDVRLKLGAAISPDFASIWSASFQRYSDLFGTDGTKSTLKRHGYMHSWGVSGEIFASVTAGAVELGGSARHGRYGSIDDLDREQELITHHTRGTEKMTELRAHLKLEPKASPLSTRFEVVEVRHDSSLTSSFGPFQTGDVVRRMSVELGVKF
jgi:hypothetical protein